MARPFLKWAGGKGKLAPRILAVAPPEFGRYHEPFVGAGAIYFAFEDARRLPGGALLSDANGDLIECFRVLRDAPESAIDRLRPLAETYAAAAVAERAAFYYEQRAAVPADPVSRVARFIFLNRTCYNGLYRVNSRGGFNVPHGRYVQPRILDADILWACSKALQGAELFVRDFETACLAASPGDFVYLDPPYQPLTQTSRFTSYTQADFGATEQQRLRDAFDDLTRRGVYALLSNSEHPAIRDLYGGRGYQFEQVEMSRAINSRGSARSPIPELLISNFSSIASRSV